MAELSAAADRRRKAAPAEHTPAPTAPRRGPGRHLSHLFWALSWVTLAVVALLVLPIQLGGATGYTIVYGHSMNPLYSTGDLVITRARDTYAVGQIVVYAVPKGEPGEGHSVVHRLVGGSGEPGGPGWTTRGDNNKSVDIWAPHNSDIRGAVAIHVAHAGYVLIQIRNPLLFAVIFSVVVGRLMWPSPQDKQDPKTGTTPAPRGRHRGARGGPLRRRQLAQ